MNNTRTLLSNLVLTEIVISVTILIIPIAAHGFDLQLSPSDINAIDKLRIEQQSTKGHCTECNAPYFRDRSLMGPIQPKDSIYIKCHKLNTQLSIFKELLNAGRLYSNDPFLSDMARAALDSEGKLYTQKCLPLEGK